MYDYVNKRFDYLDMLYGEHVDFEDGYYGITGNQPCFLNGLYRIENNSDGTCCIVNVDNGKCLDVAGNSYLINASVGYYEKNYSDAQKASGFSSCHLASFSIISFNVLGV